jgi:hypothetical protein
MRAYLIFITVVSGCGNGGSVGSTATFDDYEKTAPKVICQFYTRCGLFSKSRESACESQFAMPQTTGYSVDEAIAAGRITYDGDAAQRCLDAFSTSGCGLNAILALSSSLCTKIVHGNVPLGGACKSIIECANSYCQQGTSLNGVPGCDGTCVAYAATGDACNVVGKHCAPTDNCDAVSNTCVTLGQLGASCTSSSSCATGLACRSSGNAATCQAPANENDPCGSFDECNGGLYCDVTGMVCKRQTPAGTACSYTTSCADGTKCVGASTQMGTCQAFLDIGQMCTGTPTDSACAQDARCDATSHTCTASGSGQEGSDCTMSACGINLYCNAQKKCALKVQVGQACDPTVIGACVASATCDATTKLCTAPMCK